MYVCMYKNKKSILQSLVRCLYDTKLPCWWNVLAQGATSPCDSFLVILNYWEAGNGNHNFIQIYNNVMHDWKCSLEYSHIHIDYENIPHNTFNPA